jgi:hypothetical protein
MDISTIVMTQGTATPNRESESNQEKDNNNNNNNNKRTIIIEMPDIGEDFYGEMKEEEE